MEEFVKFQWWEK